MMVEEAYSYWTQKEPVAAASHPPASPAQQVVVTVAVSDAEQEQEEERLSFLTPVFDGSSWAVEGQLSTSPGDPYNHAALWEWMAQAWLINTSEFVVLDTLASVSLGMPERLKLMQARAYELFEEAVMRDMMPTLTIRDGEVVLGALLEDEEQVAQQEEEEEATQEEREEEEELEEVVAAGRRDEKDDAPRPIAIGARGPTVALEQTDEEAAAARPPLPSAPCQRRAISGWHWASEHRPARARRTRLNGAGGIEDVAAGGGLVGRGYRPQPSTSFEEPYVDSFIAAHQEQRQQERTAHLLMVATRTMNYNTVVYRANMVTDTQWDTENPIDIFWADIEPSYVQAHRQKGATSDIVELSAFDRLGFGIRIDRAAQRKTPAETVFYMSAIPGSVLQRKGSRPVGGRHGALTPGQHKLCYISEPGGGGVRLVTTVAGRQCYAVKIHVETVPRAWNPIPHVVRVITFGTDVETGEQRTEEWSNS
jgi:hypothetical protein